MGNAEFSSAAGHEGLQKSVLQELRLIADWRLPNANSLNFCSIHKPKIQSHCHRLWLPVALPGGWQLQSTPVAPCRVLFWHIRGCDGPRVLEIGIDGEAVALHLPITRNSDLHEISTMPGSRVELGDHSQTAWETVVFCNPCLCTTMRVAINA